MRFPHFLLVASFVLATSPGCSVEDELVDTTGGADSGGDGISLDANPPDTTVPDMPDTGTAPDTTPERETAADSTVPDTGVVPDVFVIPDTVGLDLATIDTAALDSFVGPTCATASECPGTDLECAKRACIGGRCTVAFVPAGTPSAMQVPFDCKRAECNGAGLVRIVYDPADLPNDDNECTLDSCPSAIPVHVSVPKGSLCTKGGTMCDGAGKCVECFTTATCPGVDTACRKRVCLANKCTTEDAVAGSVPTSQIAGDCKTQKCDGTGGITTVNNDSDPPADIGCGTFGCCAIAACVDGAPVYTPASGPPPAGPGPSAPTSAVQCDTYMAPPYSCESASCPQPVYCVGTKCGACDVASDCTDPVPECYTRGCTNHKCVNVPTAGGPCGSGGCGTCQVEGSYAYCSSFGCEG